MLGELVPEAAGGLGVGISQTAVVFSIADLTRTRAAPTLRQETVMADIVEMKKSTGGYMSVDAAAAVQHNQQIINNLRDVFQEAAAAAPTEQPQQSAADAAVEK